MSLFVKTLYATDYGNTCFLEEFPSSWPHPSHPFQQALAEAVFIYTPESDPRDGLRAVAVGLKGTVQIVHS